MEYKVLMEYNRKIFLEPYYTGVDDGLGGLTSSYPLHKLKAGLLAVQHAARNLACSVQPSLINHDVST